MTNYSPARLDGVPLGEIPQNQLYRLGRNIINGQGPDAPDIHPDLPTPVDARMIRSQFRPVEQLPSMVPMVMGSTSRIRQEGHGTWLQEGVPSKPFREDAALLGMTHDLFLREGEPVWMSPGHYGGHETFTLHRMGLPRRTLTLQDGTFLNVAHP